ncbi:MAG: HDIG domain-containing metalloprotein [Acidobacteriota bacterium]
MQKIRENIDLFLREKVKISANTLLGFTPFWNVLFVMLLIILASQHSCGGRFERFSAGEVAPYDIVSPFDFEIPDEKRTTERREEARRNSIDVYSYDSRKAERFISSLNIITDELSLLPPEQVSIPSATDREHTPSLDRILSRLPKDVTIYQIQALRKVSQDEKALKSIILDLSRIVNRKIVTSKASLPEGKRIIIKYYHERKEEIVNDFNGIIDLSDVEIATGNSVDKLTHIARKEKEAVAALIFRMVDANLNYDLSESVRRQDEAARNVPPVVEKFPKGSIIIRKGDQFTPNTLNILELIDRRRPARFDAAELLGFVLIFVFLIFFLWRYDIYHQKGFKKVSHLHALMVSCIIVTAIIARGIIWIANSVADDLNFPFNQAESYYFLIPVAAGAMLITLLANARIATTFSIFTSFVFGVLTGWNLHFMLYSLISSFAAIYGITQYKERTALLKTGFIVGVVNVLSIVALVSVQEKIGDTQSLFLNILNGFIGGALFVPLLVSFLLPILERLFAILTDIRLLELSNLNNPLLRSFALKVPGSYNHSLILGSIAEAAAEAVNANPLFCRVAAYYHDIGKMSKPDYFVENQMGGYNPHEKLSANISILILISHVKEGIKLAKEHGLPQQIIDIIPQHHGTRLITFFYEKAKKKVDRNVPEPDENAFRYPGPKPQTKEAAIFMLADAVEAAARTIENPTPARIKEMINKISRDIVLDGQLDQCDLTFTDLEKITSSLVKSLSAMYHRRINYPGYDFDHIPPKTTVEEIA